MEEMGLGSGVAASQTGFKMSSCLQLEVSRQSFYGCPPSNISHSRVSVSAWIKEQLNSDRTIILCLG